MCECMCECMCMCATREAERRRRPGRHLATAEQPWVSSSLFTYYLLPAELIATSGRLYS